MAEIGLGREDLDNDSLQTVQRIMVSTGTDIFSRSEIPKIVETPLVQAAEIFYDRNIRTVSSSANAEDIADGEAYIIIDFDSLSEENRQIAQEYGRPFLAGRTGEWRVKIVIPISTQTTIEELSAQAVEIAERFKVQEPVWIPRYTLADLKRIYRLPLDDPQFDDPDNFGLYYDLQAQLFFMSEEHCRKVKDGI